MSEATLDVKTIQEFVPEFEIASSADRAEVQEQLGRVPRGMVGVARRLKNREIAVVVTAPWVEVTRHGEVRQEPFPTTFYLSNPELVARLSKLEANGVMKDFETELAGDTDLSASYLKAHRAYINFRDQILAPMLELQPLSRTHSDFSSGGMPSRVKCLHALSGHFLATGDNPIGERALRMINLL
ncbi:MAG: DUF501 domain-containing protein [Candidatus Ancillula sp.]|jgi:hypothetical protein|nr:DUF501 domain-containing protein [Candidatus Ancillula sp.]